ncbi:Very short patch repair protein [Raoultella terrigena]|uniref:Very short patch repair protein n=1 Tax=Raoultella terrigena TaxID=577 RepID=A0A3P8IVW4_RAOTE|nr:Very short patch repair protein [Raoultella terrigena]
MDVHDKATRSKNMRAIGTFDTAIEKRLAGLLTQAGFSFTAQEATLPGRPGFCGERLPLRYLYPRLLLASS